MAENLPPTSSNKTDNTPKRFSLSDMSITSQSSLLPDNRRAQERPRSVNMDFIPDIANVHFIDGSATNDKLPYIIIPSTNSDSSVKPYLHDLDFSENAVPSTHIWKEAPKDELVNIPPHYLDINALFQNDKQLRIKCAACQICINSSDMNHLIFKCKPTFVHSSDFTLEEMKPQHHLVEVKNLNKKCFLCKKLLNLAQYELRCSWCHFTYHKECFNSNKTLAQKRNCTLGVHASIIIPNTQLVKLVPPSNDKLLDIPITNATHNPPSKVFNILPSPDPALRHHPLVVFVNSKSGGGQGQLILNQMLWLLNPRQVFDITLGGPKFGLSLYKHTNFRILCCGGDGTAGWINSVIEELGFDVKPPIAVLPLGTGNDLSRVLGGGSGYDNSSLTRILHKSQSGVIVELDRWEVAVVPNRSPVEYKPPPESCDNVPISTMNNYFSVGSDANAALEFHNFREKSAGKTQSRIVNKLIYIRAGSSELIKRTFADMADYINLKCDGVDFTDLIRKRSFVAVVVLNIPSYGAGTTPWGKPHSDIYKPQKFDDGLLEVFCVTQLQLSKLYLGGTGERICQARQVVLHLHKALPVQVDGEPCLLNPSIISITHKTRAVMIANLKDVSQVCSPYSSSTAHIADSSNVVNIALMKVVLSSTETDLFKTAVNLGVLNTKYTTTLSDLRIQIFEHAKYLANAGSKLNPHASLCPNWSFIGLIPNRENEFYQVLPYQEDQMCVKDIASKNNNAGSILLLEIEYNDIRQPEIGPSRGSIIPQLSLQDISPSHSSDSMNIQIDSPELTFGSESTPILSNNEIGSNAHIVVIRGHSLPLPGDGNYLSQSQHDSFTMVKQGNLPEVKKLVATNDHLMKPTPQNLSALHLSARYGHKLMTQFLLQKFSIQMINLQEKTTGQTALHRAATHGHSSVCKMLVEAGADLSIKDSSYNTAYDLSVYYGDNNLRDYLWKNTYQDNVFV